MIKTFLKTTAAVATLIAGSQSWGATWLGENGTQYQAAARTVATNFAAFIPGGSAGSLAPSGNITLQKEKTDVIYASSTGFTVTPGAGVTYTTTKDSVWHLVGAGDIDWSTVIVAGPSSGKSKFELGCSGTVTLPGTLDPKKFEIISKATGTLDLIASGALLYPLTIENGTLTLGSNITSLMSDKISGSGGLTLDAATTLVYSNLSKVSGTVTAGAATTFSTPPQQLSVGAFAATINDGGTIKKFTASADGSILKAVGNLVIEELVLNGNVTLACDAGVTVTVKKITGTMSKNLTFEGKSDTNAGGGTFVVTLPSNYTGTITESAGTLVRK